MGSAARSSWSWPLEAVLVFMETILHQGSGIRWNLQVRHMPVYR
ncbi:hypothetical protein BQ8420_02840 [Nocardiopsis sp. JB363]|nr:hypothetical protein BQ8420_02840 [Nocardiopsis sp. JB363]